MWSNEEIKEYLKSSLNENRYNHCIGVSETSKKLAKLHGADEEKAELAGLAHDCAKYMESEKILQILKDNNEEIDVVVQQWPPLMHGYAGEYVAREVFGIEDREVLNAIKYHVTGRENMTILEKVVFVADFIEPGRDFPGVEKARALANEDLDEAIIFAFDSTISFVLKSGNLLHTKTIDSRNYLLLNRKNK